MSEIKLNMRYPESRLEDITDAYTRGFKAGLAMRTDENAKLRELVWRLLEVDRIGATSNEWCEIRELARELVVEVDA